MPHFSEVCWKPEYWKHISMRKWSGIKALRCVKFYHIIFLAINFSIDIIKPLISESSPTRATNETLSVIQVAHGLTRRVRIRAADFVSAHCAIAWKEKQEYYCTKLLNNANYMCIDMQCWI